MTPTRDLIESFHLHFLRLLAGGRDRSAFVVKGGCNLRFFFGSVRYSEDLDLDVRRVPPATLKERVDALLGSTPLREGLEVQGIEIARCSAPKQTPTVQRWTLGLRERGRDVVVPTKIAFSRRDESGEVGYEAVDPQVLRRHRLMPVLACHYLLPAALRQEVAALAGRREAQARDLFDLGLLFSRAGREVGAYADLSPIIPAAIERAWSLSWADYRGQVVAYLDPGHAAALDSEAAWDALQIQVVSDLEAIRARA